LLCERSDLPVTSGSVLSASQAETREAQQLKKTTEICQNEMNVQQRPALSASAAKRECVWKETDKQKERMRSAHLGYMKDRRTDNKETSRPGREQLWRKGSQGTRQEIGETERTKTG
jgi:hypothetical protein